MNKPPFILVNEMRTVTENTRLALRGNSIDPLVWPVLHYEHGSIKELNETLIQYSKSAEFIVKKFPLVWVEQPFKIWRGEPGWFGEIRDLRIFIIMETMKIQKAHERQAKIFTPIIEPIYYELLVQMKKSQAFSIPEISMLSHGVTDRYYWGKEQQSVLNDIVECREISDFVLKLNNNKNCSDGGLIPE